MMVDGRKAISLRIKEVIQGSGLSLKDFSGLAGISKASLDNYQRGENYPSTKFLQHICQQYQLNPEWVLMGTGPKKGQRDQATARPEQDKGLSNDRQKRLRAKLGAAIRIAWINEDWPDEKLTQDEDTYLSSIIDRIARRLEG
jgi:transcriptional regulator with XRE-family HTH domain